MIDGRTALLLAGMLAVPAFLAADGPPLIGIIEFYGVRKASVEQLREALAIREGDPPPQTADDVQEIVRRLQRVRHVSRAAIDITCSDEG